MVMFSFTLNSQVVRQGFDKTEKDNWNFTTNIPFYALGNGNSDLWSDYMSANGRIAGPFAGTAYIAGRDLDNPHSEAITGEESPEHILTFDAVAINGLTARVAFRLNYVALDKNDYIYYELAYDNGSDWSSPDIHIDAFATTQGGKFSSPNWKEFEYEIPAGHDYVRMRLVVYQNGNEYIGLDNFELSTSTLSTSNNIIEGFSFSPNPTQGLLRLKAKTILSRAVVYDILGKKLIDQNGDSPDMLLDMTRLPNGIYLTRVESGDRFQTIKVIKR